MARGAFVALCRKHWPDDLFAYIKEREQAERIAHDVGVYEHRGEGDNESVQYKPGPGSLGLHAETPASARIDGGGAEALPASAAGRKATGDGAKVPASAAQGADEAGQVDAPAAAARVQGGSSHGQVDAAPTLSAETGSSQEQNDAADTLSAEAGSSDAQDVATPAPSAEAGSSTEQDDDAPTLSAEAGSSNEQVDNAPTLSAEAGGSCVPEDDAPASSAEAGAFQAEPESVPSSSSQSSGSAEQDDSAPALAADLSDATSGGDSQVPNNTAAADSDAAPGEMTQDDLAAMIRRQMHETRLLRKFQVGPSSHDMYRARSPYCWPPTHAALCGAAGDTGAHAPRHRASAQGAAVQPGRVPRSEGGDDARRAGPRPPQGADGRRVE